MAGVTTAIVVFIFVCIVYPHIVKNRPQFYAALALVLAIILLDALGQMINFGGVMRVVYVLTGFLQIGAILLLVLCAGGLSVKDLAGEAAHAFEVMRRGEDSKTVIVPLRGEVPKPRKDREADSANPVPPAAERAKPVTGARKPSDADSSLPLE